MSTREKLMPEVFKEAGFSTALIGKWHLGFYQEQYTPFKRGFEYHYGYLGPEIGYYDHSLVLHPSNITEGYDLRENNIVTHDADGKYITDVFTDKAIEVIKKRDPSKPLLLVVNHLAPHSGNYPNEVVPPAEKIGKFDYIKDEIRRNLTGNYIKLISSFLK
jgi:arylsulfatase B